MLSFGRKRSNSVVGVDISSTAVKLVELGITGGRYRVESFGVEPLPPNCVVEKNIVDIEAVGEAIDRLVGRARPRTTQAAAAVAGAAVITKVIDMDARMTDDERENQIRLDADQYIPYPLSEVNLDFEVLPEPSAAGPDRVNVLLAASRTENVEQRVEALAIGGLNARVVDVESYALERAYTLVADSLSALPEIVAIFDIGHNTTTLNVLRQEVSIYTREQNFGGRQLTEEIQQYYGMSLEEATRAKRDGTLPDTYVPEVLRPYLERIMQQIMSMLQFFFSATQYNDVDHVLLAGGGANLPDLAQLLQDRLGNSVSVANPFVDMSFAPHLDASVIDANAPALMIACGLALRSFD